MTRVKCSVLDRNRERIFTRIATRGVVKFFNVCNQEQKDIETKVKVIAGNSERKKDKILSSIDKGSFLDRLKDDDEQKQDQNKPSWSVLRDDFIMGDKIKEWNENGNENGNENESDQDEDDHDVEQEDKSKTNKNKNNKSKNKNKQFKKNKK